MASAMNAAISPRDLAIGLLRDDGFVKILDRNGTPLTTVSAERYLSRHPDTMVVDVRDEKHAVDVLAERATMSMCLDMTLLLFDHEVSIATREELATELDTLFQDGDNRDYVLDIVLCSPLPTIADVDGAVAAVDNSNSTRAIVESILECQDRVRLVFESWLAVKHDPIVQQNGSEQVYTLLARHGVFRRLASEAIDKAELKKVSARLALNKSLQVHLNAAPRILSALAKELSQKLPDGKRSRLTTHGRADGDVRQSSYQEHQNAKPQHTSVHAAFKAAMSQVERIVNLYAQLKDVQAESMLKELIVEQSKYAGGEQHVVKSLCNIATRINGHGRLEIGAECLMKALQYPRGIDSQLYLQIGRELRKLRRFDEAVRCYEHAGQLDDGSLSEKLHLEHIRVSVAKGSCEEALSEFLAIPNLKFKPSELSGLGTLYRKMGRTREARKAYRRCLDIDEDCYSAFAGLAESRKQDGKPHQAIAGYNALVKLTNNALAKRINDVDDSDVDPFDGLDGGLHVGSKKVYSLAKGHLFRLTRQYEKSEEIVRDLSHTFPVDCDVHLQYAKLLSLRGDFDRAQEHFNKSKRLARLNLGQLIFSKASERFDSTDVQDGLASIQTSLMPEDQGLASCLKAFDLITHSDCVRAQQVLSDAKYVDRFVGDLANVLRFHALRQVSSSFDYKSDRWLCRVAKRSDRSLRFAMHSIANGDYTEAGRLEREFFLRVAA